MGIINRRDLSGTGISPAHTKNFLDLIDQALDEFINVGMIDAADTTEDTQAVGFQLRNVKGDALEAEVILEFAAFDEEGLVTPAANATLDTATEGTILSAGGSNALKVKTGANGKFECTLSDGTNETVYLACSTTFGGPLLDCREIDPVTFS